ncbi:hypothetical protein, partial [Sinorhizobium meliloti]|uniref:hypothetical protein n=1 Tax=Rhizobium meliloti TaxID=382 RepID=UPI001C031818
MPLQSSSFDPRARCRSAKAEKRQDKAISFPLFSHTEYLFPEYIQNSAGKQAGPIIFVAPLRQRFARVGAASRSGAMGGNGGVGVRRVSASIGLSPSV